MPPVTISRPDGTQLTIPIDCGKSVIIVGANGSGKTRLGVFVESISAPELTHRIAAQKSLTINDNLQMTNGDKTFRELLIGNSDALASNKVHFRWRSEPAVHLLDDFEPLLRTLFARHYRAASAYLQAKTDGVELPVPTTELAHLKQMWEVLLPHRRLELQECSVQVRDLGAGSTEPYGGSQMSDGERAIFYFLGQCLLAPENGTVIVDEPETHIHKAILDDLWKTAERTRPDCAFLYITHDLDFALTHNASAKYFVRSYRCPDQWDIQEIPTGTGLPEAVVIQLVGDRKPVLFVEGAAGSLDLMLYRSQYSSFTVIPIGSCEAVIHSVSTYRANPSLHRLEAFGVVDSDGRSDSEIAFLEKLGVYVLPVAEVENALLLPSVFLALATALHCSDPNRLLAELTDEVIQEASRNLEGVSARHTIRELDHCLKRLEIKAKDLGSLEAEFKVQLGSIQPQTLFEGFKSHLFRDIHNRNLAAILRSYDNKGLLSRAASKLGLRHQNELLDKVNRLLGTPPGDDLRAELSKVLPTIPL